MIVLVEAASLKGDANRSEHLGDVFLRASAATWALRGRVVGEGLDLLKLFSALLATVLICRHFRSSVRSGRHPNSDESIGPYSPNDNLQKSLPDLA